MEGGPADDDPPVNIISVSERDSSNRFNDTSSFSSQAEKRIKIDRDVDESPVGREPLFTENTNNIPKTSLIFDQDENVDSGICVEKSESTSSDDPMPSASDNKEQLVTDAPMEPSSSLSTGRTDPMISSTERKDRNYRSHSKRSIISAVDSDDDTQMDSDDYTSEEALRMENITIEVERPESQPIVDMIRERLLGDGNEFINPIIPSSGTSMNDDSGSDSLNYSDIEEDNMDSGSNGNSDSDEWSYSSTHDDDSNNSDYGMPNVLLKRKPSYNWNVIKELADRERGLGVLGIGKRGRSDILFEQRFYGSLRTVERLELMYKLNKHKGCVNSINFHPEGKLLVSGSDDLNIVIWDWATSRPLQVIKSGHKTNIFQSKFLHLNAASQLNIVSCARDGQVRLLQVPPSGGVALKRRLASHTRPAHKLYCSAAEPHVIISAGEDGQVLLSDVRQEDANKLLTVTSNEAPVALYSVVGHPLNTNELCVAGRNRHVMLYDRRKAGPHAQPTQAYCPDYFLKASDNINVGRKKFKQMALYVTCAIYNHNGSEILASYNDDDVYLFDVNTDRICSETPAGSHGFTYRYSGHRNCATFKGVSFFGPRSEFVVSGSDCGNIYIWEKKSEAIVQWMMGDESGVINNIECHPRCPVMATCGLDSDIKIWVPSNERDPKLEGLRDVVVENNKAQLRSPLFNDFLPGLGVWGREFLSSEQRLRDDGDIQYQPGREELDSQACRLS